MTEKQIGDEKQVIATQVNREPESQVTDEVEGTTVEPSTTSEEETDSPAQARPQKKRGKAIALIVALALVCAGVGGFYYTQVIQPSQGHEAAEALLQEGKYEGSAQPLRNLFVPLVTMMLSIPYMTSSLILTIQSCLY